MFDLAVLLPPSHWFSAPPEDATTRLSTALSPYSPHVGRMVDGGRPYQTGGHDASTLSHATLVGQEAAWGWREARPREKESTAAALTADPELTAQGTGLGSLVSRVRVRSYASRKPSEQPTRMVELSVKMVPQGPGVAG